MAMILRHLNADKDDDPTLQQWLFSLNALSQLFMGMGGNMILGAIEAMFTGDVKSAYPRIVKEII